MAELKISAMTEKTFGNIDYDSKVEISTPTPETFSAKLKNIPAYQLFTATDNYTITKDDGAAVLLTFTRQALGKTITLPDATTNTGQYITIHVTGAGVGDVSLAGTGSQTLNGVLLSTWTWLGTGKLVVVSNGSNYVTIFNHLWDSGSLTNDSFCKYTNGTMVLKREKPLPAVAQSTSYGGMFRLNSVITDTFDITFASAPELKLEGSDDSGSAFQTSAFGSPPTTTTTGSYFLFASSSSGSRDLNVYWTATGTWY